MTLNPAPRWRAAREEKRARTPSTRRTRGPSLLDGSHTRCAMGEMESVFGPPLERFSRGSRDQCVSGPRRQRYLSKARAGASAEQGLERTAVVGQSLSVPHCGRTVPRKRERERINHPERPNLQPERDFSKDLTVERTLPGGNVRLSVFEDDVHDALISQSSLLPDGTTFNGVQNVSRVRTRGAEASFERRRLFAGPSISRATCPTPTRSS